ncbi:MAG: hypothetical protein K0S38_73 [Candidatus Paceibacter sp.]|nr:hypothetical protein [Candidatus Paceibacter sp.]
MSQPVHQFHQDTSVEAVSNVEATAEVNDSSPIVDNQALSAEASLSLSF